MTLPIAVRLGLEEGWSRLTNVTFVVDLLKHRNDQAMFADLEYGVLALLVANLPETRRAIVQDNVNLNKLYRRNNAESCIRSSSNIYF